MPDEGLKAGFCSKCGIIRTNRPVEDTACPCVLVSWYLHEEGCRFVRAAAMPIGISCLPHGLEVCRICDACTCGAKARQDAKVAEQQAKAKEAAGA